MELNIRPALPRDAAVLAAIESECFPAAEACGKEQMEKRLTAFPECFFLAEYQGEAVGFINGCCTDRPVLGDELYGNAALHRPEGPWQTVFGLDVRPMWQHRGIARQLMDCFIADAKARGMDGVILTCKDHLIGFYESFGFVWQGVSKSEHGGARWNDMVLTFIS